jgi:hypothetical protein
MFKLRTPLLEHSKNTMAVLLLASLLLGVLLLVLTFQFLFESSEQPTSVLPPDRPSSFRSWLF